MKDTTERHETNQAHKIRIRWLARPTAAPQPETTDIADMADMTQQLRTARRLTQLRDAQLGALLSERWQLAQERRELALEHQNLRHERWQLLQSRWSGWLQSLKGLMTVRLHKPALPRMHKLSKLTPIGQGILIWGFSGMALIGIGLLIARMRRRAAELRALDEMQDGAQLSVAKPLHTPRQKKSSVKLWN